MKKYLVLAIVLFSIFSIYYVESWRDAREQQGPVICYKIEQEYDHDNPWDYLYLYRVKAGRNNYWQSKIRRRDYPNEYIHASVNEYDSLKEFVESYGGKLCSLNQRSYRFYEAK